MAQHIGELSERMREIFGHVVEAYLARRGKTVHDAGDELEAVWTMIKQRSASRGSARRGRPSTGRQARDHRSR